MRPLYAYLRWLPPWIKEWLRFLVPLYRALRQATHGVVRRIRRGAHRLRAQRRRFALWLVRSMRVGARGLNARRNRLKLWLIRATRAGARRLRAKRRRFALWRVRSTRAAARKFKAKGNQLKRWLIRSTNARARRRQAKRDRFRRRNVSSMRGGTRKSRWYGNVAAHGRRGIEHVADFTRRLARRLLDRARESRLPTHTVEKIAADGRDIAVRVVGRVRAALAARPARAPASQQQEMPQRPAAEAAGQPAGPPQAAKPARTQQSKTAQRSAPQPSGGRHLIRRHTAALRYLDLAAECYERGDQIGADVTVAHGVEALPAADLLAKTHGGRAMCDVIEIPSFEARVLQVKWHPSNLHLLGHAFDSYLRNCDGMTTIGWALADHLTDFGPPVRVLPNYRKAERVTVTNRLREKCGISASDTMLLSISTCTSAMEHVLHALSDLPEHVHLVHMGTFAPKDYEARIRDMISELGLSRRVHFVAPVPYHELTATASGADVGLLIRDPVIANNYISLPNRVFDFFASGLPFCAAAMPDIRWFIEHNDAGAVAQTCDRDGWRAAIEQVLEDPARYRENAMAAAGTYTWESLEAGLPAIYGNPESITFIGVRNLHKNNRTIRIARSLAAQGVRPKVVTVSDESPPNDPDIEFHFLSFSTS